MNKITKIFLVQSVSPSSLLVLYLFIDGCNVKASKLKLLLFYRVHFEKGRENLWLIFAIQIYSIFSRTSHALCIVIVYCILRGHWIFRLSTSKKNRAEIFFSIVLIKYMNSAKLFKITMICEILRNNLTLTHQFHHK